METFGQYTAGVLHLTIAQDSLKMVIIFLIVDQANNGNFWTGYNGCSTFNDCSGQSKSS